MYKSELQKAQDILVHTIVPDQIDKELDAMLGTIVSMYRGGSVHVGVFRRSVKYGDPKWEVAYCIGRYTVPVAIPFDSSQVMGLNWDALHDRPTIYVNPF